MNRAMTYSVVEVIFHGDIKESVERVFAAFPCYLDNRLSFQRFERWIYALLALPPIPVAGENAGAFLTLRERPDERRITIHAAFALR